MSGKSTEPDRYAGDGVSCSQAMHSMMRASKVTDPAVIWWWGSAFKYLWRWRTKRLRTKRLRTKRLRKLSSFPIVS